MIVRLFLLALCLCIPLCGAQAQKKGSVAYDDEVLRCLQGLKSTTTQSYLQLISDLPKEDERRSLAQAFLMVAQVAVYFHQQGKGSCAEGDTNLILSYVRAGTVEAKKVSTMLGRIPQSPQAARIVEQEVDQELRRLVKPK